MNVNDMAAYLFKNKKSISKNKLIEGLEELRVSGEGYANPEDSAVVRGIVNGAKAAIDATCSDGLNRIEDAISGVEKTNDELKKLSGQYRENYNKALEASCDAIATIDEATATLDSMRTMLPAMQAACKRMEQVLRRYEKTKRLPNESATSKESSRWVCSECGTVMGRVNLFNMGGEEWCKFPLYCPGCGAKTPYEEPFVDEYSAQRVNARA